MPYTKQLLYAPAAIVAEGDLSADWEPIGDMLEHPASIEKFVNNTNTDIEISVDGVTVHDVCVAGSAFVFDDTTNSAIDNVFTPKRTQYYIRESQNPNSIHFVMKYIRQI